MARRQGSWLRDMWLAGLEAQQVIGLRLARIAQGGPDAAAESRRMVSEKLIAAAEAKQAAVNAALAGKPALIPSQTLAIVRRKIRANQKRLLASKPGAEAGRQKKGRRR